MIPRETDSKASRRPFSDDPGGQACEMVCPLPQIPPQWVWVEPISLNPETISVSLETISLNLCFFKQSDLKLWTGRAGLRGLAYAGEPTCQQQQQQQQQQQLQQQQQQCQVPGRPILRCVCVCVPSKCWAIFAQLSWSPGDRF
jgi:hypothetical protein